MKPRHAIFVLPLVIFAVQTMVHYPALPERIASHFDFAGNPNGWSSKSSFFLMLGGLQGFFSLLFWGLSVGLRKIPPTLINIPRRDYWLAPERRAASLEYLATWCVWFGLATQLLLAAVLELSIRANLKAAPPAGLLDGLPGGAQSPPTAMGQPFVGLLIAYLAFTFVWVVKLYVRFWRKPDPGVKV
jgi:hypothetical protein